MNSAKCKKKKNCAEKIIILMLFSQSWTDARVLSQTLALFA
jgi:hypothetical protein